MIPAGTKGVLLNSKQLPNVSAVAALAAATNMDTNARFIAWDVPSEQNVSVVMQYSAPEMGNFVQALMPIPKDLVSIAIASDCRRELAELYEAYSRLELENHTDNPTQHAIKTVLKDAVDSGLNKVMRAIEAAIKDRVGF